jgi:protein-tyrosine phosphatase
MKTVRHSYGTALFVILALAAVAGCASGQVPRAPRDGAVVPLLSDEQKSYLDLPREERIAKFKDPQFRVKMKSWGDRPLAVRLRASSGLPPDSPPPVLAFDLHRTGVPGRPSMGIPFDDRMLGTNGSERTGPADVDPNVVAWPNLEIGTEYEWEVTTAVEDPPGSGIHSPLARSKTFRFRTEDRAPRLLHVPGVPNARDFGGWRGLGGRRIRQGLVIRSAGLNENATPKDNPDTPGATRVTDATRAVLIGQLGVKTDVDLRWDREVFGMTGSPLGPEVRWVRCPWSLYQWVAGDEEKAMFAKIFRLLLDRDNLPAIVHCIEGQDRTGTLCFILQGLLGVSDEDKLRDWECTGFANAHWGFRHESRLDPFLKYLATLPGETVNERCVSYARSCGVTDAEIALWRERMLEP